MQRLVLAHLRLVLSVAHAYRGGSAGLDDLVSEGCLGLMEAVRRFEVSRGNRFSTYAVWWVRAHLRRYALANRRIVAMPSTRGARRVLGSMARVRRDLCQREGRPVDRGELAEALGVSTSDVALVEAAYAGRDVPVGPTDELGSRDLASEAPSPEQLAADAEEALQHRRAVAEALASLSDRERTIVEHRLLDDERTSLQALGERFGVSRERVRQIQQRAQAKLRSALLQVGS